MTAQENAVRAIEEDIDSLTPKEIRAMSYNEIIALVRETNRFPGGRRSINLIGTRLMMTPSTRVLEIGCATGSTAIELARLVGCSVTAIDLSPMAIAEAQRRAAAVGVDVDFKTGDAVDVQEKSGAFDVIICGNVTALIEDKDKAVSEYKRLLKEGGILVAAPMYYVTPPLDLLVENVRRAIQVDIPVHFRDQALELYLGLGLEEYDIHDFAFDDVPSSRVDEVSRAILARPHLASLDAAAQEALQEVYLRYMQLFRDNLALMGYSILFLRKTQFVEDPELFNAHPVDI
ncbi:MAG: class I SAM-dependent methyltransferase [Alphaproteobacteria bacterium]